MDEWVMERYELAKERIAQIPDEKMAEEPYRDFFTKEAMFLQQVIHVMDHGTVGKKILRNLKNRIMNYIRIFCPKIMKILMEILHMHRKCWENTEKYLLFFIQNFMARLLMRLKKKHGILQLYWNCFWKSILHLRRRKFLTEKQVKEILVSYVNDYCQDMVENRIREAIDPENNFVVEYDHGF